MRDAKCKGGGDCGVDGVAAPFENELAGTGGVDLGRDDHAPVALARGVAGRKGVGCEQHEEQN